MYHSRPTIVFSLGFLSKCHDVLEVILTTRIAQVDTVHFWLSHIALHVSFSTEPPYLEDYQWGWSLAWPITKSRPKAHVRCSRLVNCFSPVPLWWLLMKIVAMFRACLRCRSSSWLWYISWPNMNPTLPKMIRKVRIFIQTPHRRVIRQTRVLSARIEFVDAMARA